MSPVVAPTAVLMAVLALGAHFSAERGGIERELRGVDAFEMFFFSRTGEYAIDAEDYPAQAGVYMRRHCGGNCHRVLGPVLDALEGGTFVEECPGGNESVVFRFGGRDLVFSHGGLLARVDGGCIVLDDPIHDVLRAESYLMAR